MTIYKNVQLIAASKSNGVSTEKFIWNHNECSLDIPRKTIIPFARIKYKTIGLLQLIGHSFNDCCQVMSAVRKAYNNMKVIFVR